MIDASPITTMLPTALSDSENGNSNRTGGNRAVPERPNSERGQQFALLVRTIKKMADLPSYHDLHVDLSTASLSIDVLGLLYNNQRLDPPKMFPHEGDNLVLTWDAGALKRLLTVAGDGEVDLLDLHKATQIRCKHLLELREGQDFDRWIFDFVGEPLANSSPPDAAK